nr:hypothetical protein [uncultured Mediterranean phage uvMED]
MKPEDIQVYYGMIGEVEYAHTYWNSLKVSVRKEDKTEQQIQEELMERILSEEYQELDRRTKNPPPINSEEI